MNELMQQENSASALVEVEQARAIQEVRGAIVMAKQFPRNEKDARDRIVKECQRPALADAAIYAYPRGGQTVSGPSIRLAEAIAQNWGNFQHGWRELARGTDESTIQAYAWDLQTNTRSTKEFQIRHLNYSREGGNKRLTTDRDIYEMAANQAARRVRACILSLIPGDLVEAALNQCDETQKTAGKLTAEKIQEMVKSFNEINVKKETIEQYLKHPVAECSLPELLSLSRIRLSIKDGISKPEDFFYSLRQAGGQAQGARAAAAAAAAGKKGGTIIDRLRGTKQDPPQSQTTDQGEEGSEPPDQGELY